MKTLEEARTYFEKLNSVEVKASDIYDIEIEVVRYRHGSNQATSAQVNYLTSLVSYKSKSNLMKLNKYAASAIISFAKENEDMRIKVIA